jgi:hypothetical protein
MTVGELLDTLAHLPREAEAMVDFEAEPLLEITAVVGPNRASLNHGAVVLVAESPGHSKYTPPATVFCQPCGVRFDAESFAEACALFLVHCKTDHRA